MVSVPTQSQQVIVVTLSTSSYPVLTLSIKPLKITPVSPLYPASIVIAAFLFRLFIVLLERLYTVISTSFASKLSSKGTVNSKSISSDFKVTFPLFITAFQIV